MSPGRPNPYPGPRAFKPEESGRFFGRETEIRHLGSLVVARRVVLLYAASGAGKSSLLAAGLAPHLRRELPEARVFPIARVSGDPPAGLPVPDVAVWNVLNAILDEGTAPAAMAGLTLRQGVDRLLAGEAPEDGPPPAFLILDQLEELFNDGHGDPRAFFLQLREALDARPELSLILALREDSLAQLDPYKVLLPDQLRTRYRLELLGPETALEAIEGPARIAGCPFAPGAARQLADDLRRSLAESPEGGAREELGTWIDPVQLQVVCHRIWASLPAEAREIDEARAHAAGSVDALLARHYDEKIAEVAAETGAPERALRRWIDQLFTAQGQRGQIPRAPGATGGLDNRAVEALVDTHLVRAERRRGMVWYELSHDRLLRPVRQSNDAWQEAHRSLLERQADLWVREGKPRSRLLSGGDLAAAEKRLTAGLDEASGAIRDFLDACLRARRRRVRRWRQAGLGITLALVAALGGFAYALWEISFSSALSTVLLLDSEIRRRQESELDLALLLAVSAQESTKKFDGFKVLGLLDLDTRHLLSQVLEASPHLEAFLPLRVGEVSGVAFSPDGRRVIATTTTGGTEHWELATRRHLGSAGEGTLLFQPPGGTAPPPPPDAGVGPIARLASSPDGELLAVGGATGRIALWDMRRKQPLALLTGKMAPLSGLAFSPDGAWLVSGHGRTVVLWRRTPRSRIAQVEDPSPGAPPPPEPARATRLPAPLCPAPLVTHITLSKGPFTAAGCSDGTLLLIYRLEEGTRQTPLFLHPLPIQRLALAQDAETLAAATSDGAVWLVDIMEQQVVTGPLHGHLGPVASLAFEDPAGLRLLSVGADGRRIHWNLDPADWRRIACAMVGRNMTEAEHARLPFPFLITPSPCIQETP